MELVRFKYAVYFYHDKYNQQSNLWTETNMPDTKSRFAKEVSKTRLLIVIHLSKLQQFI